MQGAPSGTGYMGNALVRAAITIGVVLIGIWLVPKGIEAIFGSNDPYRFDETLSDMKDDFGDDAKVVSMTIGYNGQSYSVISGRETVTERSYSLQSEQVRGPNGAPASSTERDESEQERPITRADGQDSIYTLGQIDDGVVERMWDELGFPDEGSLALFDGKKWILSTATAPFDSYEANVDGTGIRQVKSKESTFGF